MQYFNNILCFEAGWLIDNKITTKSNYDNLAKRKQIQVVRRASRNTPALVAYDSMPDRFKEAIIEKIGGNPYKLAKINELEELIEHNTETSKFFNEDFKLGDGRYLPKATREEYYYNAIILDAIAKLIQKVALKKAKGHKTGGQWNYYSELVQSLDRTKYPHTLPEYFSSLREKYNKYKKESCASLIHANFLKGIKNAATTTDTKTYLSDQYWKLADFLNVINVLNESNYVFFTSNKSSLIELCEWLSKNHNINNPFENAVLKTHETRLNPQSKYIDMMLTRMIETEKAS